MRQSWLLYALFALNAVSSAMNIEDVLNIDGIEAYLQHGIKKRATGTGNSAPSSTPPPSSSEAPSSTADDSSTPISTAPAETSSSDDQPSSTAAPSSQPSSADASSTPAPSSTPSKTSKTVVVSTSFQVTTSVEPYTTVVFATLSDGETSAFTSVGSRTAVITTGQAEYTSSPGLSGSGGSSGSGLSDTNKKVIGGVVGGVGSAILLGGIAAVCWRIWGRKRRVSEEDDDLMAGTGTALGDKTHASPGSSPFQNNLEQYHNPGGRPNAAANF